MPPVEFVRVRHPDVEGTAVLARSALAHLPGWVPVDDDPAPTRPEPGRRARRRPDARHRGADQSTPDTTQEF